MHNLAIALHNSGHEVSGSDDQIFEPSRSRLAAKNLLPKAEGWDDSSITKISMRLFLVCMRVRTILNY